MSDMKHPCDHGWVSVSRVRLVASDIPDEGRSEISALTMVEYDISEKLRYFVARVPTLPITTSRTIRHTAMILRTFLISRPSSACLARFLRTLERSLSLCYLGRGRVTANRQFRHSPLFEVNGTGSERDLFSKPTTFGLLETI
jgi:hypothetical protein